MNQLQTFAKFPKGAAPKQFALLGGHCLDANAYSSSVCIIIKDGKILEVSKRKLDELPPDLTIYDASGYWITPGFCNAHSHASLSFLRGHLHHRPLAGPMVEDEFFPREKVLTSDLTEAFALQYFYDGLMSGVTFYGEHYYHISGVARALARIGLKGVIGETVQDLAGPAAEPQAWDRARAGIESWSYKKDDIAPAVCPHATDTVSETLLETMAAYAADHHLLLHMHLAQSAGEDQRTRKRTGVSPVECARRAGVLQKNAFLVHLVRASAEEIKMVAQSGASIGFCPASQMLFEELAPIEDMIAHQARLCVSTDCAPSNDSSDVLAEARLAALVAKDRCGKAVWEPRTWLSTITDAAASALGAGSRVGRISAGYAADLVFFRDNPLWHTAGADPYALLLFSVGSRFVEHVMVNGSFRLFDRRPTLISEDEIRLAFSEGSAKLERLLRRS